jgi:hypothetical protein
VVRKIGGWRVAYTDRQVQLIRDRLIAYHDVQSRAPQRATWGGLCDEIFELAGAVQMDEEVLRQFARRVARKDRPDRPRIPSADNLEAIVKFLCHKDVDMLSIEELQEPEIPYRLARSFSDFLQTELANRNLPPPKAINGSYRAVVQYTDDDERIIDLTLTCDDAMSLVRFFEDATSYSTSIRADNNNSPLREESQRRQSEGWGILTPEDNLLVFMKPKRYGGNYYYLTLSMDKNLRSRVPIGKLLLLRHQYPVQQVPVPQSFDELKEESDGDTILLHFDRLDATDSDSGVK